MRTLTTTLYSGLAALSLLVPAATHAETTVATVPQGYVTLTVSAGMGSSQRYNLLYAPLHSASTASGALQGQITAYTSSSLTNANAAWTDSQLSTSSTPHFIKITSGSAAGHTFKISANTSTVLTLDTQGLDITTLGVVAGDTYQIFKGDTLLSLFGTPGSPYPVVGGSSASNSVDQVLVHNGVSWDTYFYNTSAGQWRKGPLPFDQGSVYIRPDTAFIYARAGTTSFSMTVTGEVPTIQCKTVVNNNSLTVLASFFPSDQTIGSLNIQNLPGWKKVGDSGVTSDSADKLMIHNGVNWDTYHYNASAGQWRKGALPFSYTDTIIPAGTGIVIQRSGTAGTSVLTLTSPYNL